MRRFLHVAFNSKDPRIDQWTPVFDKATDWLRYAPNCWIIYTGRDPEIWFDRVKPLLREGEHVLICELKLSNRRGWLPKSAWEWINRTREDN